jgi:DNA invertase Pin-like site-specific DNA recombinase
MRVAIYIRVSKFTSEATLDDQERICREYAQRHGWRVVRVFRDAGKSAYKDDLKCRPEFGKLLNTARSGAIQAVIVYKLDRFARRARIYHNAKWDLERAGVQLVSASEVLDNSASGNLSSGMLAQFAEFYSAQLSERIKAAYAGKATRGEWVGDVPVGYERHGKNIRPGPLALWVIIIFLAYAQGHSSIAIARALNGTSIRLRSGKRWTKDSVLKILHNRAYIGYGSANGKPYKSNHESLVTDALFAAAAERLASRHRTERRPRSPGGRAAPLDYEVRCAVCNSRMYRHTSGNTTGQRHYFRCVRSLEGECSAKGVSFERIDGQVAILRQAGQTIAKIWAKAPRGIERWEGC